MSSLKLPESVPSPAQDSERLREVFRRRKNKNASEIIWILGHRDSKHRKEIKYEYEKLFGQSLIKSLHSELSASAEFKVISSSMVGSKADIPDSVTRVIVSRAERDLVNIKAEYLNTNKTTLSSALTGDTYYKDFLMALLGEQL